MEGLIYDGTYKRGMGGGDFNVRFYDIQVPQWPYA